MWFTADTHFGHSKILEHDGGPFKSIEERDEMIIENWNKVVKPTDTVWHLGDFAFRNKIPIEDYFKRLNGRIHFVRGNHDDKGAWKYRDMFESAQEVAYIKHFKQKIFLFHYACRTWRGSHRGTWHLFGHSHGCLPDHGKSTDVGINLYGYRPAHFDELKPKLDHLPNTDHHPALEDDE